jgi:hypothetical protein
MGRVYGCVYTCHKHSNGSSDITALTSLIDNNNNNYYNYNGIATKGLTKISTNNTREAFSRFCTKKKKTSVRTWLIIRKLEIGVVGCTIGSRGEVPGRKETSEKRWR